MSARRTRCGCASSWPGARLELRWAAILRKGLEAPNKRAQPEASGALEAYHLPAISLFAGRDTSVIYARMVRAPLNALYLSLSTPNTLYI